MHKELVHSKSCLLGGCHFEEMVLKTSKKKAILPFLTLLCFASPVYAGTFNVTDPSDLKEAISLANQETDSSVILLPGNTTFTLQNTLPPITSPITFVGVGPGPTQIDGQGKYQLFSSNVAQVSIQNLHLRNFATSAAPSFLQLTDTTLLGTPFVIPSGAHVSYTFNNIDSASLDLTGDGARPSATGGLTVSGAGTLTLTHRDANYAGSTTVLGPATVSISQDGQLGLGKVNLQGSDAAPATLLVTTTTSGTRPFALGQTNSVIETLPGVTYKIGGSVNGGTLDITGCGQVHLTNNFNTIGAIQVAPHAALGLGSTGSVTAGQPIHLVGTLLSVGSPLLLNNPLDISGQNGHIPTVDASMAPITLTGAITGSGATQLRLAGSNNLTIHAPKTQNSYSTTTISTVNTLASSGMAPFGTETFLLDGTATWNLLGANLLNNHLIFGKDVSVVAQSGSSNFSGPIDGPATVTYSATAGNLSITPTTDNSGFTGTFVNANAPLKIGGTSPLGAPSATYVVTGASPLTQFITHTTLPTQIKIDAGSTPTFEVLAGTTATLSGVISDKKAGQQTGNVTFRGHGLSSHLQLTGKNSFTINSASTVHLATITAQVYGISPFGASTNSVTLNGTVLECIGDTTLNNRLILASSSNHLVADTGTISSLNGDITSSDHGTGTSYHVGLTTGSQNGTIILAGPTTGAPSIILNQGTLQTPSPVNLGTGPLSFAGFGGNLKLAASSTAAYNNPITVAPSTTGAPYGGSIIVDPLTSNTWSGAISGHSPLAVRGKGTLALGGANNAFSGGFYVEQALVRLASKSSLGTGSLHLSHGGTIELPAGEETYANTLVLGTAGGALKLGKGTTDWSGTLSGTDPLSLLGPGTLIVSGDHNSTFSGGFNVHTATLQATTPSDLGTGPISINGGTFALSGTEHYFANPISLGLDGGTIAADGAVNTLAGDISGTGGLTLPGPGSLIITGTNSYRGGTHLEGGTIEIGSTSPLGIGNIFFEGGDLDIAYSTTLPNNLIFAESGSITAKTGTRSTLIGSLSGRGTFTKAGEGTLAIRGNSPYFSGHTRLNAGMTQLCGINPLGTGPITFNGGDVEFTCNTLLSNSSITLLATTTFTADPQTSSLITSPISGALTGLTKDGTGLLILSGANTYSGDTHVSAGILEIDGTSPNSKTIVDLGATLTGIGTVKDVDVFGTLAPGNPTGTLTTTKTTFEVGSTFQVYLNGVSYASLASTGNVSILPGTTLLPIFNPYLPMTYTIVNATGFVTGRFLPISPGSARFPVTVRYDRHTVKLTVSQVPFANIIPNGNAHHIGVCFDSLIQHITPELQADLYILDGLSTSEIGSAFDQFDPAIYNAIFYAEESVGERVRNIYTQHGFDRQFDPCFQGGIWTAFYGEEIQQHKLKDGQAFSGYKDSFNGIVVGLDGLLSNGLASTGFAYTKSKMYWTDVSGANAHIESYTGFIGGAWYMSPFMVDAFASYTRNVVRGERSIFIGPSTEVPIPPNTTIPIQALTTPIAKSISYNNNSTLYTTHVGMISKREIFGRNFFALSYGNLDYLFVKQEPFNESGGGATNLSVHGNSSDFLRPELGFGVGFVQPVIHCGVITGDARVGFVKELRFIGHSTVANFTGNGCNFTVGGLFPRQNLVSASVNLLLTGAFGFDLAFDFEGLYGSHYASSAGKVELTYLF